MKFTLTPPSMRAGLGMLALLLAAPMSIAGPGSDALAAGDYQRAVTILLPQARRGDSEAQFLLGRMHEQGLGIALDRESARAWYSQAAAKGHGRARAALAALDAGAPGRSAVASRIAATTAPVAPVLQTNAQRLQALLSGSLAADRQRAVELAQTVAKEAEAGDTVLAVLLGEYFESALAGSPDYPAAARWYARAASDDHPVALNNLGAMFYDGRGVLQSYPEAQRLYQRAAQGGDRVAQFNLALMLGQGRAGPVDVVGMIQWMRKSSDQNYARAQAQLARFHLEGVGMPQDLRESARLFRLAADQGLPGAQYWLGRMTARGEGVQRDLAAGANWIIKAADGGVAAAMLEAAKIYEMGLGMISDNSRALAMYRRAGEAGIGAAADRLAIAYAKGELGLKADADEAARWAALASK